MKTAISIGNFDAVHQGHIALVRAARKCVLREGRVEIWTFDPPPVSVLNPSLPLHRLTTFQERSKLLLDAGADAVRKITPTAELLGESPESFIEQVVKESSPEYVVEGEGFRFGKNRSGTTDTLRALGERFGFSLVLIEPVVVTLSGGAQRASSSSIRTLLLQGRVNDAKVMLNRDVKVTGIVTKGNQRGREMGVPTANLTHVNTMLPKDGIYAGSGEVGGKRYTAAISIGTKPTFGAHERVLEAHLISFDGDLEHYGWPLTVTISQWIREQVKFDSMESLRVQIESDIQEVINRIESTQ
ncbi:MAG: bifunctional riboflavin kinase/FMN adenylyltransferase [Planctomycetes bacterium]|nr:bifunctional riboflavin kinase/FMN adenylyltransferase [Planctomycetota bacterium]